MQKASATSKENGTTSQTLSYATIAADILRDLAQASHIPFLQKAAAAISCVLGEINVRVFTSSSFYLSYRLTRAIQGTKTNQEMLSRIVELVHQLTCAVIHLCLAEQGVLPIKILDSIGHFVKYVLLCAQNLLIFSQNASEGPDFCAISAGARENQALVQTA
jgi:hypothetical protein